MSSMAEQSRNLPSQSSPEQLAEMATASSIAIASSHPSRVPESMPSMIASPDSDNWLLHQLISTEQPGTSQVTTTVHCLHRSVHCLHTTVRCWHAGRFQMGATVSWVQRLLAWLGYTRGSSQYHGFSQQTTDGKTIIVLLRAGETPAVH